MSSLRSIFLSFIILSFLVSCTDIVELDVEASDPELVVDGLVTNDQFAYVRLSETAPYFDNSEFKAVSGARVSLFKDGQEHLVFTESTEKPGYYESNYLGEFLSVYQLRIDITGGASDPIIGTWWSKPDTLREVPAVDSLQQRRLNRNTTPQAFREGEYAVMFFGDLPGAGDYYRLIRSLNDSVFAQENNFISDEGFDEIYFGQGFIPPLNIYGPFEDPEEGEAPDSLSVVLQSVSPDYFDYMQILNSQVQTGSPFDAPPALVLGNLYKENDTKALAFGYFRVAGSSRNGIRYRP